MVAGEQLVVGDERVASPHRERLAELHQVPLIGVDVAAEFPEHLDVAVDALALHLDAELLQPLYDPLHREAVPGVSLPLEDLLDIEGLELGLVVVRHRTTPPATQIVGQTYAVILPLSDWFLLRGVP